MTAAAAAETRRRFDRGNKIFDRGVMVIVESVRLVIFEWRLLVRIAWHGLSTDPLPANHTVSISIHFTLTAIFGNGKELKGLYHFFMEKFRKIFLFGA